MVTENEGALSQGGKMKVLKNTSVFQKNDAQLLTVTIFPQRFPIDQDLPSIRVVEAHHQLAYCGFPTPPPPHNRELVPRLHHKAEAVESRQELIVASLAVFGFTPCCGDRIWIPPPLGGVGT